MTNNLEKQARAFIDNHVAIIAPKYKEVTSSYFNASVSGKAEDYQISADKQLELETIYTNKEEFEKVKSFIESWEINDPLLKRELEMLFLSYKSRQIDKEKLAMMVSIQNTIDNKFATFRPKINDNEVTDNEIKNILTTSTSSDEVKQARLASKEVGTFVAPEVLEVVKLRNEVAYELGYKNYHEMSLLLDEQDPKDISELFDELDDMTRDSFIKGKLKIDKYLSNKFNISIDDIMPRHYQNSFFQEAPTISSISLDKYYENQDIVELSRKYYNSLNLPIDDLISNSDLYEKPWKYQHAYCINIDRIWDIRVICNIKSNQYRMNTQLHEFGHAIYEKNIDPQDTPFLLHDAAHTFTTEAIAMMFGKFASNPQWIRDVLDISEDEKNDISEACFEELRLEQLVFSRRAQVMYRFEKAMYSNPNQDLNKLRRDIVEKYQMIKRPVNKDGADWASKIHIASSPCYYHNYLLWELLASQIYHHIVKDILKSSDYKFQSFYNKAEVGVYLKEKIFSPGRKYHRNTMIEWATGEKLTPKYYAQQFIG